MVSLKRRILSAVLYADIFQYPMTHRELVRWIPTSKQISNQTIQAALHVLVKQNVVRFVTPFIVIKKHTSHIGIHAERLVCSQKKWKKAYVVARFLRLIPTVLYVGVTGSLAMNNADIGDDIDICIVASKGTVWITRLLATCVVEFVAKRRRPTTKNVQNTICLNMFISENALKIATDQRDAYIAHELLQMVPLWERKGIERKLLLANQWVKQYYYHAYAERLAIRVLRIPRKNVWEQIVRLVEKPARHIQLLYMKNRRTTEVITDTVIRFHPTDMRRIVLTALHRSLAVYKIPLDKEGKKNLK
ncbi:MAG: hypothetical protein V1917_03635 [Candidatus Gottesmanbacteria bacterium]